MNTNNELNNIKDSNEFLMFVGNLKAAPIPLTGGRKFVKINSDSPNDAGVSLKDVIQKTHQLQKTQKISTEVILIIKQLDREGNDEYAKAGDWSWRHFTTQLSRFFGNLRFDKTKMLQNIFENAVTTDNMNNTNSAPDVNSEANLVIKLLAAQQKEPDIKAEPFILNRLFALLDKLHTLKDFDSVIDRLKDVVLPKSFIEAEENRLIYLRNAAGNYQVSKASIKASDYYKEALNTDKIDPKIKEKILERIHEFAGKGHYRFICVLRDNNIFVNDYIEEMLKNHKKQFIDDLKEVKPLTYDSLKNEIEKFLPFGVNQTSIKAYEIISEVLSDLPREQAKINAFLHKIYPEGFRDAIERDLEKAKLDVVLPKSFIEAEENRLIYLKTAAENYPVSRISIKALDHYKEALNTDKIDPKIKEEILQRIHEFAGKGHYRFICVLRDNNIFVNEYIKKMLKTHKKQFIDDLKEVKPLTYDSLKNEIEKFLPFGVNQTSIEAYEIISEVLSDLPREQAKINAFLHKIYSEGFHDAIERDLEKANRYAPPQQNDPNGHELMQY